MQRFALILASVALVSCSKDAPVTTTPDTTVAAAPASVAAPVVAEPAPEEPKVSEAEAKAAADAEEMKARIAKRLEHASAKADEVKARWTPEVVAAFEKTRDKKYGNDKARMKAVLKSQHRAPGNAERDAFRRPAKTLAFFGLKSNMKVFEVGQGAGWYTEILAPFVASKGQLYLAGYDAKSENPQMQFGAKSMEFFLGAPGPLYSGVETVVQGASDDPMNLGPAGSLDMVLVVRMFHNVERFGLWDRYMLSIHSSLKDGAVLGVVQHRAAEGAEVKDSASKGYLPEQWLVAKIEGYGFKLDNKSELNANRKDTHDHEQGVWSLPPTYAGGDTDRAKLEAVGESDRSTLRFIKVAKKVTN